jgi:acetyl-CoA carboxylase biotin carboxyl carrier protein
MDLRKIKKLMELLEESGIAEIEVKEGEESIKLSRNITSSCCSITANGSTAYDGTSTTAPQ